MRRPVRPGRLRALVLLAVVALLLGVHLAYQNQTLALSSVGLPVMHVTIRGRITQIRGERLTVNLEDSQGELTGVMRDVVISDQTRVVWPGQPRQQGSTGLKAMRPGYVVLVKGEQGSGNAVQARVVLVGYPPIVGTVSAVKNGVLTVAVNGQANPVTISLTSHTAFFVPGGQWSLLTPGAPVLVHVRPMPNGSLVALAVLVKLPSGGS